MTSIPTKIGPFAVEHDDPLVALNGLRGEALNDALVAATDRCRASLVGDVDYLGDMSSA